MAAIGVGLAYIGYCGVLWGVFLVSGKNVGVKQLFGKAWPPKVPGATTGPANATQPGGTVATGTTQAPGTTTAGGRG